jgi:PIN domain nuclease of toxin-antitoxin system
MRLLLDTHALIWFLEDDPRLSIPARTAIESKDSENYLSLVTGWEMAIKVSLGKLRLPIAYEELFPGRLVSLGFIIQQIEARHFHELLSLPLHHRDPFDRLLVAQAKRKNLTLVTCDPQFAAYHVSIIW